jgi:hypothetical protein
MTEIADIQEPVIQYAERKGFLVRRMQYIGRRACADVFLFKDGRTHQIEFKNAGEKPDPLQKREHTRLFAKGIIVHVVDDVGEGKALVDWLDAHLGK